MAGDREGDNGATAARYDCQIGTDAQVFTAIAGLEPNADVLRAYWAGARGLLQYYEQFHEKVDKDIDPNTATDWERGQLDGVRWVGDYLRNLFGL